MLTSNESNSVLLDQAENLLKKKYQSSPSKQCKVNEILQVLNVRKLDQDEKKELRGIKKIREKYFNSKICDQHNSAEVIGIPKSYFSKKIDTDLTRNRNKSLKPSFSKSQSKSQSKSRSQSKKNPLNDDDVIHVYSRAMRKTYKKWDKSKTPLNFYPYLFRNAKKEDLKLMQRKSVAYFTDEEAAQYEVNFKKYQIFKSDGSEFKDGRYMFVLDITGHHLFITKKKKGKLHHTSFTRGDPVQCAGFLQMENNVIVSVHGSSGHYLPTENDMHKMIDFLIDRNHLGDVAKNIKITLHTREPVKNRYLIYK